MDVDHFHEEAESPMIKLAVKEPVKKKGVGMKKLAKTAAAIAILFLLVNLVVWFVNVLTDGVDSFISIAWMLVIVIISLLSLILITILVFSVSIALFDWVNKK